MGFMDKIKKTVGANADKAGSVIDKAANMADDRTGRKHSSKIDSAAQKAKRAVDNLDGKNGRNSGGPTDPR